MAETLLATCFVLMAFAVTAQVMSDVVRQADSNGDGVLTMAELRTYHPDATEADFMAMDLDADGALDAREVTAAEEAGMIPTAQDEN